MRGRHQEYELKLAVDREHLAKLEQGALLHAALRREARRRHLVTTYFDTPSQGLRARGVALRVRRDEDRVVQDVKTESSGPAVAHLREEDAVEILGTDPDISRVGDPDLRDWLATRPPEDALMAVFTTDVERSVLPIRFADSDIELAVDVGRIRGHDGERDICEAELELVAGRKASVIELALALRQSVPFRLESRSKARRGYALIGGEVPEAQYADPVTFEHDVPVGAGFEAIMAAALAQLRGNEQTFLEAPRPEVVHQLRVGVRRMRACLSLFGEILVAEQADYLKGELRWLQQQTGAARDWDVFASDTVAGIAEALPGEPAVALLREAADAAQREGYAQVAGALADPRYIRLLLTLELWFEEHAWLRPEVRYVGAQMPMLKAFLATRLEKWDRKIRKRAKAPASLSADELHALRIRAKKLRYAAEFAQSLYGGKAVARYRSALADLQDVLGYAHDADVARRLAEAAAARLKDTHPPEETALVRGLTVGWGAARATHHATSSASLWKAFRKQSPFWGD